MILVPQLRIKPEPSIVLTTGPPREVPIIFCFCVLVSQSCLTLCNPMDCSPPSSSVHGILQARILGWVAISFSKGSSQPRDQTQVSCVGRWILYCLSCGGSTFLSWFPKNSRCPCACRAASVPGISQEPNKHLLNE